MVQMHHPNQQQQEMEGLEQPQVFQDHQQPMQVAEVEELTMPMDQ
jgi:hypothetical protein